LSSISSFPAAVESCSDTFTGWTGRTGGLFKSDNKATLSQQCWSWGLAELGNILYILIKTKQLMLRRTNYTHINPFLRMIILDLEISIHFNIHPILFGIQGKILLYL
jgi:hypothetical protein